MAASFGLPVITDQHAFNLERWGEICADPLLAAYEFRVESDRFGHAIMMPPSGVDHSSRQSDIAIRLHALMRGGKVLTECPVSTSDGIKGVDVAWISTARMAKVLKQNVLVSAPEICVEVISPGNTRDEIEDKKRLYFESGAEEVWCCDVKGRMAFFAQASPTLARKGSVLCPDFPGLLE